MIDVLALAEEHLALARESAHGRSAHTYLNEGTLRQAVIVLTAGTVLGDHDAPPAASLHVLSGRVQIVEEGQSIELGTGQAAPIPQRRHSLKADEDSAVILTSVVNISE
ncbi:cupin [Streptosporangium sp. NBC_01755]|uniref:cupin n=1 Tax=Streptosporangium sp. NBC_01755 TaxID=2975949 RepID=UPI002DD852FD|nr:cupin [Streptosporangium sp. NBC_01755]WSD00434.1 cupin [Streptosporangium sp. NBC_01755]